MQSLKLQLCHGSTQESKKVYCASTQQNGKVASEKKNPEETSDQGRKEPSSKLVSTQS